MSILNTYCGLGVGFSYPSGGSDTTVASPITLSASDYTCNSVVVANGGVINTNNFRIFARTQIIIEAGGMISANGGDASGETAGVGNGGSLSGGPLGGSTEIQIYLGSGYDGGRGKVIGGVDSTTGQEAANSCGGGGGTGASTTDASAKAGGTTSLIETSLGTPYVLQYLSTGFLVGSKLNLASPQAQLSGIFPIQGGAGGGGGGAYGATARGGGGGGGGGVVVLSAPRIIIEDGGWVTAYGGDGGDGALNTGTEAGGGGGGGGGVVILHCDYLSVENTDAININGGLAGLSDGSPEPETASAAGSKGSIFIISRFGVNKYTDWLPTTGLYPIVTY